MKNTDSGIEREVDKLGRVVLPMDFRKKLGIERNSRVLINIHDDTVLIKASVPTCAICKKQENVCSELGLCPDCIKRVKSFPLK